MRLGALLSPEEALEEKLAAGSGGGGVSTPILTAAPKVNGTTGTNGPSLAPDGNGGITPAFVPVDFEPFVICAPGWTGPDCKTRISDLPPPTGLPTGVEPAPPGTIVPSEVTRAPNGARPDYEIQNGVPVRMLEKEGVEKGFLVGPIAIAAAVTVGLIVLLRGRR